MSVYGTVSPAPETFAAPVDPLATPPLPEPTSTANVDRQALLAFLVSDRDLMRWRGDWVHAGLRSRSTLWSIVFGCGEELPHDELDLIEAGLVCVRQNQQRRTRMTEDAVASVVGSGVPSACVADRGSARLLLTRYGLAEATEGAYSPATTEQHPHPRTSLVLWLCLVWQVSVPLKILGSPPIQPGSAGGARRRRV